MNARIENYLAKIQELPWALMSGVIALSFVLSSALSLVLARVLLPSATIPIRSGGGELVDTDDFLSRIRPTLEQSEIDKIIERNIFNHEGTAADVVAKEKKSSDDIIKTDLPLNLQGTIYGGSPTNGIAVIENTSKKTINSFSPGDSLATDATLKEIYQDRVIISRATGQLEFLQVTNPEVKGGRRKGSVSKSAPVASVSTPGGFTSGQAISNFQEEGFSMNQNEIEMTGTYKDQLLGGDFTKVLQDAKASPNLVEGQLRGFILTKIKKGSIYEKAGLQDQDIVEEINGVPLNDTAQAIKFLNTLRGEKEIEIRLKRGGASVAKTLRVR